MSQDVGKLRCQIAQVPLYMTCIKAINGNVYGESGAGWKALDVINMWVVDI
jgi:hypothetical protein